MNKRFVCKRALIYYAFGYMRFDEMQLKNAFGETDLLIKSIVNKINSVEFRRNYVSFIL